MRFRAHNPGVDPDSSDQDRVDREVALSRSRLLMDAARRERESSQMNRWASERERAYTAFLSLRSLRATAKLSRERSALTRERSQAQIRIAARILERARELQRCSQLAVESSAADLHQETAEVR